jgi:hypothetical protein
MLTIWKYTIPVADDFSLSMPAGASPLSIQVQYDEPQLWALVDPDETVFQEIKFRLAGTGHPINIPEMDLSFIGTFQLDGGSLVFHLFEVMS